MKLEKLYAMQVAAQLTASVMPKATVVDMDLKDPSARAMNSMAWEVFRVFYRATVLAMDDETSWPSPSKSVDATGAANSVVNAVSAAIPGLGPILSAAIPALTPLLTQLVGQFLPKSPATPSTIPDPGLPKPA